MNSSSGDHAHTASDGHGALPMPSTETAFPVTAAAWKRLADAIGGLAASHRRSWAGKAYWLALRLDTQFCMDIALAGAAAAGFTLTKDGQEYGVFVGGARVTPRTADGTGRAPRPPVIDGESSRDNHNNTDQTPPTTEEEGA